MDVDEAVQRIFRVRGLVIVGCFALGLLGGYAAHKALEHVTYTASARLTLSASVPQDSVVAAALAGTVEGMVTSPDQVNSALKKAAASRDIVKFTRSISTQSLSDSGVLKLSVTDTDARLATSVANALASAAVTAVNQQQRQPSEQLLSQLQTQITAVRAEISGLDAKLAAAESNNAPTVGGLVSQRSDAAQQLTALLTQQTGIEQQLAQTPGASIVSPASRPLLPDPSQLALDAIIGALAGLILGIALAALAETRRPTLVGAAAIERALQAPVLGVLPARRLSATTLRALSVRLRRAADEAQASTAVLWSPYGVDLTDIARQLQAVSPLSNTHAAHSWLAIRTAHDGDRIAHGLALVYVVPPRVPARSLEEAEEFRAGHELPLLGTIIRNGTPRANNSAIEQELRHLADVNEPSERPAVLAL